MIESEQKSATPTEPNEEVLEAQARVCTGPHQSRPLGVKPSDPQPDRILEIIVASLRGHHDTEPSASRAQIGAFLCAMTLRRAYPEATNWSNAERTAFDRHTPALLESDPSVRFLLQPTETGSFSHATDQTLARYLVLILAGNHLSYADTRTVLRAVTSEDGDPALKAAVLIGQRMNHEDMDEFRAYLDSVIPPEEVQTVSADSLTTIGEPYNGSTRYFKPTCFVAAVRAALGRPTLLHGVDIAPPKRGVTESQILAALGAGTRLSVDTAGELIERTDIGFAYLSQADFAPHVYGMLSLRAHIGKRPTWAASEKAQQILKSTGRNDMVVGYFHSGYEQKQLASMRERGLDAGCVIKGEEGTSQFGLRSGAASEGSRKTLNYVEGFRAESEFAYDINPAKHGFVYDQSPRPPHISAEAFAKAGYDALGGSEGHLLDRILFNTGMIDWLLGYEPDPTSAIQRARNTIIDGTARAHLDRYVEASQQSTRAA